ncbi:MFS general substrate transporter [Mycena kentingensis (nom. inval.)]|nr:MFS general substrate transporter [Mycena kentingensis (nom. inval.)]
MFNNCNSVTIHGGTFNLGREEPQEDFRRIRVGDINIIELVGEWKLEKSLTSPRRARVVRTEVGTRRAFQAKIFGSQDIFTFMQDEYDDERDVAQLPANFPKLFLHSYHAHLFGCAGSGPGSVRIYPDQLVPVDKVFDECPTRLFLLLFERILVQHSAQCCGPLHRTTLVHRMNDRSEWFRPETGQLRVIFHPAETSPTLRMPYSQYRQKAITPVQIFDQNGVHHPTEILLRHLHRQDLMNLIPDIGIQIKNKDFQNTTVAPKRRTSSADRHYGSIEFAAVYRLPRLSPSTGFEQTFFWRSDAGDMRKIQALKNTADCNEPIIYEIYDPAKDSFPVMMPKAAPGSWYSVANSGSRRSIHLNGRTSREGLVESWLQSTHIDETCDSEGVEVILTDLYGHLKFSDEREPYQLSGTFMADAPTNNIFFNFQPPLAREKEDGSVWLELPSLHEFCYWSYRPGGPRLEEWEEERHGLPRVEVTWYLSGPGLTIEDYAVFGEHARIHGTLPAATEVSQVAEMQEGELLLDTLQKEEDECPPVY